MSETPPTQGNLYSAIQADLSAAWNIVLLRSVLAIIFGGIAVVWPMVSLIAFVFLYAFYALMDGILSLYAAIRGGGTRSRWWLVFGGIAGLVAGGIAIAMPGLTALVFVMLVGAAAIVRGAFDMIGAFVLRKTVKHSWILVPAGIVSVLFGILVLAAPAQASITLTWVIGAWAIVLGIAGVIWSLQLRKHAQ
ncbi:HdeD family acid-resistance protein [Brevundimonas sp. BH3]|uniref:HdeD family acid-resistance protein n=1 Tax=Brevundimonas sp. BH3 TaxID=3133089 RepID=UPI0032540F40